jgi:hypothetical protein
MKKKKGFTQSKKAKALAQIRKAFITPFEF